MRFCWSFLINTYSSQQIEVCLLYLPAEQNTIVVRDKLSTLRLRLEMQSASSFVFLAFLSLHSFEVIICLHLFIIYDYILPVFWFFFLDRVSLNAKCNGKTVKIQACSFSGKNPFTLTSLGPLDWIDKYDLFMGIGACIALRVCVCVR